MKKPILLLATILGMVVMIGCKKEKQTEEPVDPVNPSETAGPETAKVLHYNFNGNYNDGSGNGLHAQNYGSNPVDFSTDRFGRSNMAIFLRDSGVVVTPSLKDQNIGFPFSISVWFNAPQVDSLQTIIQADAIGPNSTGANYLAYNGFYLQIGGTSFNPGTGRLSFTFGNSTCGCPTGRTTVNVPDVITPGDWHHVVVNVNGPDDNMEVYLNGVLQSNTSYDLPGTGLSLMTWLSPGSGIQGPYGLIGQNINPAFNNQQFKNGRIDDYRVYKKKLTATEVQSLYNLIP